MEQFFESFEIADGIWRELSEPVSGITREGERKGSTGNLFWCLVEVYVGPKILQMLNRIFEACVKWNIRDLEFLGESKVDHLLDKQGSRLLQEVLTREDFPLLFWLIAFVRMLHLCSSLSSMPCIALSASG